MSDCLRPHGLQHARFPCPPLSPWVYSNSCPLIWWCHPTNSSCVTPSPPALNLSSIRVFSNELTLASTGQSIWVSASASASVLPMNIQGWFPLGLRFDLLAVQGTLKSLPQNHNSKALVLGLLCGPTLTSVHDYWKNQSFDHTYICWQTDVPAFNMLSRFVIAFCSRSMCVCVCVCVFFFFKFHVAVTIYSDFGVQENKNLSLFPFFPLYLPWGDGTRCHDLSFLNDKF